MGLIKQWIKATVAWQEGQIARIEANAQLHKNRRNKKRQDGIFNDLIEQTLTRNIIQIQQWRSGLESWEDRRAPDRSFMHEVYREVELDPQVAAKVGVAEHKIEASEFSFVDPKSNEDDVKLTEMFKTQWFSKFLKESLKSDYMGYTLFQFPKFKEGGSFDANQLEVVPRWLVLPDGSDSSGYNPVVIPTPGAQDGIRFKDTRHSKRLLGIGDKNSFGMFAAIAPLYIYKKNALSFWSAYQQRFGEPIVAIKSKTDNKESNKTYRDFLKNRSTNSGIIVTGDDEAEMLEANKHDAYNLYQMMLTYCDEGISKALEGNTLTTDSGGGKTKGDVHADVAKIYHLGRLKKLAFAVNDHLMPFLEENYDFDFKGKVFRWREFKDVDAEVDNVMKLSTNFNMSNDQVKERTGYIVEGMKETVADSRAGNRKKSPDKDDDTAGKRT